LIDRRIGRLIDQSTGHHKYLLCANIVENMQNLDFCFHFKANYSYATIAGSTKLALINLELFCLCHHRILEEAICFWVCRPAIHCPLTSISRDVIS